MGIYVKFSMTTHQIWSSHVILSSNSENFYLSPNSILKFRRSFQILGKLAQEQKSYRQKQIGGGKHPHPQAGAKMVEWSLAWGRPALVSQKFLGYIQKRSLLVCSLFFVHCRSFFMPCTISLRYLLFHKHANFFERQRSTNTGEQPNQ